MILSETVCNKVSVIVEVVALNVIPAVVCTPPRSKSIYARNGGTNNHRKALHGVLVVYGTGVIGIGFIGCDYL